MNSRLVVFFCNVSLGIMCFATSVYASPSSTTDYFSIPPRSVNDVRSLWTDKLLSLALSKTQAKYGPFSLKKTPAMDNARRWVSIRSNRYENFYFFNVYNDEHKGDRDLAYIEFPINQGLLSYRVCFKNANREKIIADKIQLGDLRRLTFGLRRDWADIEVLEYNGYKVIQAHDYDDLFRMAHGERFDLMCRGVSEIYDEYHYHKIAKGLMVEQDLAFHYPMPVFFYMNKRDIEQLNRVREGLSIAYEDGSMKALFIEHFQERLAFVKLWDRKIIKLENPRVRHLDSQYQNFHFDLKALTF